MSKKNRDKGKGKPVANPLLQPKKRRIGPGVVIVVVLVLALGAGVGVQYWRSNSGVSVADTGPEPTVISGPVTNGKGITVGQAAAKTNIDVYVDFRCPHCKEFEDQTGPALSKMIDDGTAKVTYWPLMFLDPQASPRIANAFASAAAQNKAQGYLEQVFSDFAKAWTDDQLIDLGKELGLDEAKFSKDVKDGTYRGWLDSVTQTADQRKVSSTPTVFVNDKQLSADQLTPEGLQSAVVSEAG